MRQSEIWLINLDPTKGAEIQKKRPAVIVNDDALGKLPLKIIVPITDWKDRYEIAPWMVKLKSAAGNGLRKDSAADGCQVRSLSQNRFIKRIGSVNNFQLDEIKTALKKVFSL